MVAPDFVDHAPLPGQAPGPEGAKRKWAMYLDAIPDLRVTIEELMAEGDKVAVRRSYQGAQRGDVGHTGHWQAMRVGGISIFRLAEGRIAEHWGAAGSAGLDAAARRGPGTGCAPGPTGYWGVEALISVPSVFAIEFVSLFFARALFVWFYNETPCSVLLVAIFHASFEAQSTGSPTTSCRRRPR